MARPDPNVRKEKRTKAGDAIAASTNKVSDTIQTGLGNLIGGAIEKIKLGGKEASGKYKFSETLQGRNRKKGK